MRVQGALDRLKLDKVRLGCVWASYEQVDKSRSYRESGRGGNSRRETNSYGKDQVGGLWWWWLAGAAVQLQYSLVAACGRQ